MRLDVSYDDIGIIKDVDILDLNYKEWILIQVALDNFIKQKRDILKEVEKEYFKKLESNASATELGITEMTISRMGNDIFDIQVIMDEINIYNATAPY